MNVSNNIFDDLPDLAPVFPDTSDELDRYLMADVANVKDGLRWWNERRSAFLRLSCMACDYLLIPGKLVSCCSVLMLTLIPVLAMTVDVEHVFSQGCLVLPHVCSRLSVPTTRALMCIGAWSRLGLVKDGNILAALGDEVNGEEPELLAGWDAITAWPSRL
jgi:hypothetical protein